MRTIIVQFDELGIERDDGKSCGAFTGQVEILVGEPEAADYEAYGDTYVPIRHSPSLSVGRHPGRVDQLQLRRRLVGPPPLDLVPRLKDAFLVHYTPIIEERIGEALAA